MWKLYETHKGLGACGFPTVTFASKFLTTTCYFIFSIIHKKIPYNLSEDLRLCRSISFITPRSNYTCHLADGSHHLLWCFSPFLGRGLPAAKVSRQPSSYKMKMMAPQTNPKLEGQGFSLFLAPCSKPVWHAWSYPCGRHSCESKIMVQIIKVWAAVQCYCRRPLFVQLHRKTLY